MGEDPGRKDITLGMRMHAFEILVISPTSEGRGRLIRAIDAVGRGETSPLVPRPTPED